MNFLDWATHPPRECEPTVTHPACREREFSRVRSTAAMRERIHARIVTGSCYRTETLRFLTELVSTRVARPPLFTLSVERLVLGRCLTGCRLSTRRHSKPWYRSARTRRRHTSLHAYWATGEARALAAALGQDIAPSPRHSTFRCALHRSRSYATRSNNRARHQRPSHPSNPRRRDA